MNCPNCGHKIIAVNQSKGGKSRWRGMTKAQRSKAASKASMARWNKKP